MEIDRGYTQGWQMCVDEYQRSQTFEDLLKAAPGMGARNAELYILLDNTFDISILLKFRPTLAI